jgi:hypothetical protein
VLERDFQPKLIKRIEALFPGCRVLKNDTDYLQGIPDLTILYRDRWAVLEVKRKRPTKESDFEPNQEWYIEQLNKMSYSACVYPENVEEILDELQQAFTSRRKSRVSQR